MTTSTWAIALQLQLARLLPSDWITLTRRAREAISGDSGTFGSDKDGGFTLRSTFPADNSQWLLPAISRDLPLGGGVRKSFSSDKLMFDRRSCLELDGNSVESRPPPLDPEILDSLIDNSFGARTALSSIDDARRPYASAGGLYTVQIFILRPCDAERAAWSVQHYLPQSLEYEHLGIVSTFEVLLHMRETPPISLVNSDALLCYLIVPELSLAKYGPRGYKFALIEIGAMMASVERSADRHHLRCRPYGFFDERSFPSLLGVNPDSAWVECIQFVGRQRA